MASDPLPPLIPSPDTVPVEAALDAAVQAALGNAPTGDTPIPIPLGRSWLLDPVAGRLVRSGGSGGSSGEGPHYGAGSYGAGSYGYPAAAAVPSIPSSPREVSGIAAFRTWALISLYTTRLAHLYVPEDIGVEFAEGTAGLVRVDERLADYQESIKDAMMKHDRVTGVAVDMTYDAPTGVLYLRTLDITLDDEAALRLTDITLQPES